ncbi:hypothetical protein M0R45_017703 [Rubus argutus]|uniref:BTB domain-containing protein n=1 Tax=Rubus argutus TaxID=59490 RepID=A0AAW1XWI0_RUBAR
MTENSNSTSLVRLNVGGKKFSTYMDTLTQREPNSLFGAMFSGRNTLCQDDKGYVFIDRNGEYFGYILDWLRDDDVPTLEDFKYSKLLKEAQYFQLQGLIDGIHVVLDNKKEKKLGADLTRTDIIKYTLYHDSTHEKLKFQGVNLSGLDLSGLNLSNMDFSYACMRNVCFSNANISNSRFDNVDARGANFNKANLKESSFWGANLQGASAVGVEFSPSSIPFHGATHEPELMNQVVWNRDEGREINFQTSLQTRNRTLRRCTG